MPEFLIEWSDGSEMTQLRRIIADSREDAWQKSGMWIELLGGRNVVNAIYQRPTDPLPARVLDRPVFGGGIEIIIESDSAIERRLDQIVSALANFDRRMDQLMATVQEALDAVTAARGQVDSLITLVRQLHDIIVNMPAGGLTAEQQAAIDNIKALSDLESTDVQAAVAANQPPTPPTP